MNEKSKRGKNSETGNATAFLEGYLTCAKEMDIPLRAVCERLGEILSAKGQRTSKHLPVLRTLSKRNTPRSKAVEQVESVSNPHRRAQAGKKKQQKLAPKVRKKPVFSKKGLAALRATAAHARAVRAAKLAATKKAEAAA